MLTQLKTPGAFIEEVSKFPPSVAQVETAIPVFIGITEKATRKVEGDLSESLVRITSLLEYETLFGGAKKETVELIDDAENGLTLVAPEVKFLMPYAMQLFFANGGGPCYIISIGGFVDESSSELKSRIETCLAEAAKEDEITLLVFPDATQTLNEEDFYGMYQIALDQANELKDRFVLIDTYKGTTTDLTTIDTNVDKDTIFHLRNNVPGDKYGAAYFPYLKTILNPVFNEKAAIVHTGTGYDYSAEEILLNNLIVEINADTAGDDLEENRTALLAIFETINETYDFPFDLTPYIDATTSAELAAAYFNNVVDAGGFSSDNLGALSGQKLEDLKGTTLYNEIQALINAVPVVLPPSAAMAGVYAKTDSTRGVWKAPANVGLNFVVGPTEKVDNTQQDGLNVDATAGKSINVIRTFTGKGTLVWGARTLDGNSNGWRYISVRRFFNMVEESVKKASERFVFDSNDANTWIRVKGMIENFLNTQWRAGALAGATPEDAYFVSVGLDETMSAQDILEGRMIVEIGMAAVRPAEFIILRFSHKLQES
ncbi:phage tail sheath C-terminal domain-containing protein [uncultured Dokdonia sp.]|uniref:phage tail sheath family protein n=1 Tax=uncultured Dokdonia sp. TaxID=575653 RepID=UPI00261CC561|nr:phage tail sheath C-terminal domain-containing protein [uncultured Dokdonia sp.]